MAETPNPSPTEQLLEQLLAQQARTNALLARLVAGLTPYDQQAAAPAAEEE